MSFSRSERMTVAFGPQVAVDVVHQLPQGLLVHDRVDDVEGHRRKFLQDVEKMVLVVAGDDGAVSPSSSAKTRSTSDPRR
jgi:hypothetical protein